MEEKVLLLHIGIMKTGTKALQQFFYDNAEVLKSYGWNYIDFHKEIEGLRVYEGGIEKNGVVFYTPEKKIDVTTESWDKIWKCLREHLQRENVILSAEEMYLWDTDVLLEELKKKYDNIKVIVYLRRQDRLVESIWNHTVKAFPFQKMDFKSKVDSHIGVCYYFDRLERISSIVGKENVIVRAYEKQQFEGCKKDISSDFLQAIGLFPDWSKFKPVSRQNERLQGNFVEIKRIFNSVMDENNVDYNWEYTPLFMKISELFGCEHVEAGYFSKEERDVFLGKFEEQNRWVAHNYLGRDTGELFYDNKKDYVEYSSPITSFEEDLIHTFASIIYEQNYKLQQMQTLLERKCQNNVELIILSQKGTRKLAYFGAGQKCREMLKYINLPVEIIVDNDNNKAGTKLNEIDIVYAPNVVDWSQYFIIVTCVDTDEIEVQLQSLKLQKNKDYVLAKEYLLI